MAITDIHHISTEPENSTEAIQLREESQAMRNKRVASGVARAFGYLALVIASAGLLLPFIWMLISSLKRNVDVFTVPIQWIPDPVVWSNYVTIWERTAMGTWFGNTLFISVIVTILQLFTGAFAAYGFARMRFPGRDALFLLYLGTIAVPWQAIMIPQFIMLSAWGLANTRRSIILLQAFGAFGVFLMKQYFESIPESLAEAARIDGLSEYGIWWRIMLPLSGPAIASLTLLTFVNTWNDFLGPLLYLRGRDLWTVQVGLRTFIGQFASEHAMIMTGSVLSILPIAVIFFLGQRYFVEGIATTGVKG